ncbi:hypothetical protein DL96DRAFT_1705882 [Flagelloscypha sp. PMI_526]|nr:hypothetical protein DL96DRAFT_1705882 [Flagelloscypha sp. PMI_526]
MADLPATGAPSVGGSMSNELPVASNIVIRAASDEMLQGAEQVPQALETAPVSQPGVRKRKSAASSQRNKATSNDDKAGTRAKSGCYTCRIRRKKCDERTNENGACETCVRLRLQCLGFGPKRPEWLRSQANVTDLRNRIKDFLASQGMIKGHANNRGPGIPELDGVGTSSGSAQNPNLGFEVLPQPVTPALTLGGADTGDIGGPSTAGPALDGTGYRTIQLSSVRDKSPSVVTLDPALAGSHEDDHNGYPQDSPCPNNEAYREQQPFLWLGPSNFTPQLPTRASASTPLPTLILHPDDLIAMDDDDDPEPLLFTHSNVTVQRHPQSADVQALIRRTPIPAPALFGTANDFLGAYKSQLLNLQFLMGDPTAVHSIILHTLEEHRPTAEAAMLLAKIAFVKTRRSEIRNVLQEVKDIGDGLEGCFNALTPTHRPVPRSEAILALMAVSVLLFAGGQYFPAGRPSPSGGMFSPPSSPSSNGLSFLPWIDTLLRYAKQVLRFGYPHSLSNFQSNPSDLRTAFHTTLDSTDRFIILTSIWFDTVSSITSQEAPLLGEITDALMNPSAAPNSQIRSQHFQMQPSGIGLGLHVDIPPSSRSVHSGASDYGNSFGRGVPQYGGSQAPYTPSPVDIFHQQNGSYMRPMMTPSQQVQDHNYSPVIPPFMPAAVAPASSSATPYNAMSGYRDHYPTPPHSDRPLPFSQPSSPNPQQGYHAQNVHHHAMSMQTPMYVEAWTSGAAASSPTPTAPSPPPEIQPEDIMGASSLSLWTIAQTSLLELRRRKNDPPLDNMQLVTEGQHLLSLLATERPSSPPNSHFLHIEDGGRWSMKREREVAREVSKRCFNAAATLYVCSVIEFDKIGARGVKEGVEGVIKALRAARKASTVRPPTSNTSRLDEDEAQETADQIFPEKTSLPVLRSLYFPIFICGALTNDPHIRAEIEEMLRGETMSMSHSSSIGNAASVLGLLRDLWRTHAWQYKRGEQVNWREGICSQRILLI